MTREEFLTTPEQVLVGQLCGAANCGGSGDDRIDVDGYAIVCVLNRGLPHHSHGAKKLFSAGRIDEPPIVTAVEPEVAIRRLRSALSPATV